VPVKGNCVDSGSSMVAETLSRLLLSNLKDRLSYAKGVRNITSSSFWRTTKFPQINCLTVQTLSNTLWVSTFNVTAPVPEHSK